MSPTGSGPARRPVGYYVHHHGHGHRARAEAVLRHLRAPAVVLTSAPLTEGLARVADVVPLPLDTDVEGGAPPSFLHYAPIESAGLRERMATIAAWAARARPALLVVDVSVEVALLGRLLGLPVVVVRQHGTRTDLPHRLAYEAAAALLAPYPVGLEDDTAPDDVRAKTHYAGGFSRFDGRPPVPRDASDGDGRPGVLVLSGSGGSARTPEQIAAAARATPDWEWTVLGGGEALTSVSENVRWRGWTEDPWPHLSRADVVVAHAGHNAVMEVAAARRPLVCLPEARPFDEQHGKARALERLGAALVLDRWPKPAAWPRLLADVRRRSTDALAALNDGQGAIRAAAFLDRLAGSGQRSAISS